MKTIVIIATKNRPELLKNRSLKSVYAQNIRPDQIIIVDDSDEGLYLTQNESIVANYKIQNKDVQIDRILNHRTKGASGSWNSAVDYALSQNQIPEDTFIAILDDDDEWLLNYLEQCSEEIIENKLDMVATDFLRITDDLNEYSPAPKALRVDDFLVGNPGIQGSNTFVRLSCFLEAGCFDENIKSCTDRDLCIRITDLGGIKYKNIESPLMIHFAEGSRIRMSTPNTLTKNEGLNNFWLKHSRRMSSEQKNKFLDRAKTLFSWELPKLITKRVTLPVEEKKLNETFLNISVGIICSKYKIILPLLQQLDDLQSNKNISRIEIILFENNLSTKDKSAIERISESLKISFITKQMQDDWISSIDYFKEFSRNKNELFSIAQARTMLQKFLGQKMKNQTLASHFGWILDEDMQILPDTIKGIEVLPQLKNKKIDIVIGKYEYASPNPPINGIRVQLVDLFYNLNWLSKQNSTDVILDFSSENDNLMKKYTDYYYDLSRKHYGHLEHPFWIEKNIKTR